MSNVQSDNMFSVPIWRIRTNDWKRKKKEIKKHIDFKRLEKKGAHTFSTDRQALRREGTSYIPQFSDIFKDELDSFLDQIKRDQMIITDIWTVTYKKHELQSVHNHGSKGFSSILFLDFDPKKHIPTCFISPFPDPYTDSTSWYIPSDIREGDFIFFPSLVLHHFMPNQSFKVRRCIGFDIKTIDCAQNGMGE